MTDQLTALRSWLATGAAKLRHNAILATVPECQQALDGMAAGHQTAVYAIDQLIAGHRLPVSYGRCTRDDCPASEYHPDAGPAESLNLAPPISSNLEPDPDYDQLRDRYSEAMREHYLSASREEADADGNLPCRCGDWREPGPMGSDEDDWDSHLADVVMAERDAELAELRERLAESEAEVRRLLVESPWLRAACEDREQTAAELARLRVAIAEVRRFCELNADCSVRVQAAEQARDTLRVLDRALNTTQEAGR